MIERGTLRAYSGVSSDGLRLENGSASSGSILASAASCSGVRRTIHTGLPRHSTVIFSPGRRPLMSACTGAPAALARSDGAKLDTKGTATAAPPTAPAPQVMAIQVRRPESTLASLMLSSA